MNLNHPFSGLHLNTGFAQDDTSLRNSFWYAVKRDKDPWRDALSPSLAFLTCRLAKGKLTETYQRWIGKWRSQLQQYQERHPGAGLPAVTEEQLSRPFQPLLPNTLQSGATFVIVQRVFQLPFSVRLYMVRETPLQPSFWSSLLPPSLTLSHSSALANADVSSLLQLAEERSRHFRQRFLATFHVASFSPAQQAIAAAAVSNLIGGISFFVGSTVQETPSGDRVTGPFGELLTAIPGRSYFPRGFVWDEGFHELVVSEWNLTLSRAILASWIRRIEPSVWHVAFSQR